MPRSLFALLFAAILIAAPARSSFAQYGELARRLPSNTNTILLLNVDQAHKSPLGVKEGWREDHEKQFSSGLVIVPPQANKFVMAAQLDFNAFRPKWQVAMMELKYEPQLVKAAARLNGTVDNIGGRDVAVLPGDMCVVKMGPKWAGIRHPADRQETARWLNAMDQNTTGKLSPYMASSVKFAEAGAPLIMALDLEHVFSEKQIRPILDELESLKGHKVDKDALAKALASIKGISLGVTIGQERFGKLKVDFGEDVTMTAPYARSLFLEILGRRGMMIDEFTTWKIGGSKNQITLEGKLFSSGTRRILSVLDAPPELHQGVAASSQTDPQSPEAKQKEMALATKQYFDSINTMLDDLRLKRSEAEFVTWNQVGTWWEKYARKVDRLPTLNVDPEMLEWGRWVADSMRGAENALKGIGPATRSQQSNTGNYYTVNSWSRPIGVTRNGAYGWGGWYATENLKLKGQEYSRIRTQERIRGNMSANNTAQAIQASIGDMRRHMTQKYQIQF